MKHEVTSYNTKRMIADSLKKLMKNKPFSKITVSDIVLDCGINRKTFYYHFEDIFALLKWLFEEEAIEVVKHFDLYTDYKSAILFTMDYVNKNDYLINCAYDSLGRDYLKNFFFSDFVNIVRASIDESEKTLKKSFDPEFKEFAARFFTEALTGMIIETVKEKDDEKRKKDFYFLIDFIGIQFKSME